MLFRRLEVQLQVWKKPRDRRQEVQDEVVAVDQIRQAYAGEGTALDLEESLARAEGTIQEEFHMAYSGIPDQMGRQGDQSAVHKGGRTLGIEVADSLKDSDEELGVAAVAESGGFPEGDLVEMHSVTNRSASRQFNRGVSRHVLYGIIIHSSEGRQRKYQQGFCAFRTGL